MARCSWPSFVDAGGGRDKGGQWDTLASVGGGLRWAAGGGLEAIVYKAFPLHSAPPGDETLQDRGIHFRIGFVGEVLMRTRSLPFPVHAALAVMAVVLAGCAYNFPGPEPAIPAPPVTLAEASREARQLLASGDPDAARISSGNGSTRRAPADPARSSRRR